MDLFMQYYTLYLKLYLNFNNSIKNRNNNLYYQLFIVVMLFLIFLLKTRHESLIK